MVLRKRCVTVLVVITCVHAGAPGRPTPGPEDLRGRDARWILPDDFRSPSVWGIRGGIVMGLWPHSVETTRERGTGGPRGLLRIGYEQNGLTYLINFIAVEPVVEGTMEFSEISNSTVDDQWGKLMWAGATSKQRGFFPFAATKGNITRPDPNRPELEELSLFVFIEKFRNGAHPYLKVTLRNDRPYEIGLQVFQHDGSAAMERCALTATMGNYSRLRRLYLKDRVVDARELYRDSDSLHFVEKPPFGCDQMLKDENGDFIALCTSDESLSELTDWPQEPKYLKRSSWCYRPDFKLTQYWRKPKDKYDPSLHIRINGRKYYWAGASGRRDDYVPIPGGTAFENFELREKYYPGQQFYFGLTPKTPEEMNLSGATRGQ
ncbi:MAG: hypothetical protein JW741_01310 [Sedimentisphaerales bacterium]|nr:hypothetical protein [Sedimentisphaerales bacterium]